MPEKPNIWLVDTSVFLNVLDVPGRNQDRKEILPEFAFRIKQGDTFLMPYAVVVETGNFIAQLNGNHKLIFAKKFVEQVRKAINGEAPWKLMRLPTSGDILLWLDKFPALAATGVGFADFSMIQELKEQRKLFAAYEVQIWSLDGHLQGY
jgi:hypothetical protein